MAGSLRKLFESIVYAGMKPGAGAPPEDPLYLTNRTWKQRLRLWIAVATPVAVLLAVVVYGLLTPPAAQNRMPAQPSPEEIAAGTAILPKGFKVAQNNDVQVTEAAVENTGDASYIIGTVRNNTAQGFAGAELVFDLTDNSGSRVGAASGRSPAIGPNGTVQFRLAIPERNATIAIVREVRGTL